MDWAVGLYCGNIYNAQCSVSGHFTSAEGGGSAPTLLTDPAAPAREVKAAVGVGMSENRVGKGQIWVRRRRNGVGRLWEEMDLATLEPIPSFASLLRLAPVTELGQV